MRVVGFVPDLIDQSRITSVVPGAAFVSSPGDMAAEAQGADFALLDLSREGAVECIASIPCRRIVGFANHTAKEAMKQATAAGAVTMARSDFFIRLEELLLGNPT